MSDSEWRLYISLTIRWCGCEWRFRVNPSIDEGPFTADSVEKVGLHLCVEILCLD
jgi:hypothetical protein